MKSDDDEIYEKESNEDESEMWEVKTCSRPGCLYAEKRTSSNFRYHYSVYHDEEPYPQYSFKIKRMAIKRFKNIKKIWLESPKRNKRLKQRRASEIENWQRKKRKKNEDSE